MYVMTKEGVLELKDGVWQKTTYALTINGEQYMVKDATPKGNLILARVEEVIKGTALQELAPRALLKTIRESTQATRPTAGYAPARELSADRATEAAHAARWSLLKGLLWRYMHFHKDGRETTGQERMVLAEKLTKYLEVSMNNAWAWIRKDGPVPQPRNQRLIAKFLKEQGI